MTYATSVKFILIFALVELQNECYAFQNITSLNRRTREACRGNEFKCGSGECIPELLVCDGERNCKDRSDETSDTCINLVIPVLTSYLEPSLTTNVNKCPSNQFRCDNGDCIPNNQKCNDKKDCSDGSDEKDCRASCRSDEFKCKSGSCIASNRVCNGLKDCDDGSDESPELCSTPPRVTSGCQLPSHPQNGKYHLGGCEPPSCQVSPGTIIPNFGVLNYTCNEGFKLSGQSIILCNNEAWSSSFPTCERVLCPALINPTRSFECILFGNSINCNEAMEPGTKARIRCESFHFTRAEHSNYEIRCKENGEWSGVVFSCTPECGLPNPNGLPFISNGRLTKLGEFPWHVGIFKIQDNVYNQHCGGNIVTSRVIITAAHCFWNETDGKLIDSNNYRIAAGKYYRNWDNRTRYFEKAEIEKVYIPGSFKGITGLYADDIAVVKLKKSFKINEAVRPICLDLDGKFSEEFKPGKSGIIIGWGYTEEQIQTEELHAVELPYVGREECIEKTDRSREAFIQIISVRGKFCVGTNTGKSVCPGDSGGGYAVKFRNGMQYYLMGIVSAGVVPQGSDNCDITHFSVFTKVSEYYSFIRPHITL